MGQVTYIGLGSNCYVSWTLRRLGLQVESLPLDWVNSFDFSRVAPFLSAEPNSILQDLAKSDHHLDENFPLSLFSKHYDFRLPHEFDIEPDITLDGIRSRYKRRVDRFWRTVNEAERVVFIRALNDGLSSPRETFAETTPLARSFLATLSHLRVRPSMILFSYGEDEPVDPGGYDIAQIDKSVPMECIFYEYGTEFSRMEEQVIEMYRRFFALTHLEAKDMPAAYESLKQTLKRPTDI